MMAIMSFLNKYVTKDKESFRKFKESIVKLTQMMKEFTKVIGHEISSLKSNPFIYIISRKY